jgi:hypothetical protein
MIRRHLCCAVLTGSIAVAMLGMSAPVSAQAGAAATSGEKISQACADPAYRQFDYWLGEWAVTDTAGTQVGTNHVIRVSDGCAILEQWKDATGNAGTSINMHDAAKGTWEQHWMGAGAGILHLVGKLENGTMTLQGKRDTPQGVVLDRVRWVPEAGDKVRQLWAMSRDDGKTWAIVFNGLYARARPGG